MKLVRNEKRLERTKAKKEKNKVKNLMIYIKCDIIKDTNLLLAENILEVLFNGSSHEWSRHQESFGGLGSTGTFPAGWLLSRSSADHEANEQRGQPSCSGGAEQAGARRASDSSPYLAQQLLGAQPLRWHYQAWDGLNLNTASYTLAPRFGGVFFWFLRNFFKMSLTCHFRYRIIKSTKWRKE